MFPLTQQLAPITNLHGMPLITSHKSNFYLKMLMVAVL